MSIMIMVVNDVEMLGFRAKGQGRTLKMTSVQKGDFIKAQRRDLWAESCTGVVRSGLSYTSKLGGD